MANLRDLAKRVKEYLTPKQLVSAQPWNKSGNKFQDQEGWFRGGQFTPAKQIGDFLNKQNEEAWKPTGIGYKTVMGARNLLGTDQSTAGNYLGTLSNTKRFAFPEINTPYKGINFAGNLVKAIPESLINIPRNIVVGPARIGNEINLAKAQGRKVSPLTIAEGVAPLAEGMFDMATLGGSSIAKELIKKGGKQTIKNAIIKQGIKGAEVGSFGGLTYGVDQQYGKDFNVGDVAKNVAGGAVLGGVLGGGMGGVSAVYNTVKNAYRKLGFDEETAKVLTKQHFVNTKNKPITPRQPKAQREFWAKINKQLGRPENTPVYQDDLKSLINKNNNIPDTQLSVGMQVKPKEPLPTDLLSEARKYKSAEEFVKAQGEPLYHRTNADFQNFDISKKSQMSSGIHFFSDKARSNHPKSIERFGNNQIEAYTTAKLADITPVFPENTVDISYKHLPEEIQKIVELPRTQRNQALKDMGYGGFKSGSEIVVFDPKNIKTKSQLTDIYNQATKGVEPKITATKLAKETPLSRETMQIVPEIPVETAKPTSNIRIKTPAKSITQEANQKLSKVSSAKSLDNIISTSGIDVKNKVNLIDYIRTPDRVLKKIGLGNESVQLRKAYDNYLGELPKEISKITDWSKQVSPESNQKIFKYLDGQKVLLNVNELKVAKEIRTYLEGWADKLGLEKSKRITNYITHIFDKDFIQKEFDPDIARLIQDRVAGSVYDPFTEKRLGKMGYLEDTWKALDAYVKRAVRKVNMDPVLEVIKEKSKGLEQSQFNYVKSYTDRINMRPTAIDNLLDNTVKSIVGYKFGQRPVAYLTGLGRQAVYRGALGLNVGSALRNLSQGTNTYAKLGEKYTAKGYFDLIKKGTKELEDVGVLRDDLIQDRTLSATKQAVQKMDKVLFYLFETAEKINRGSAYYGAKAKALAQGLSENEAIDFAKNIVRDTQFTFGRVDTPVALQSDLTKLASQFQSFTLKQGEFLGEMLGKKDFAGLARYTAGTLAYVFTVGQLFGMKPKDIIPSFRFSAPPALGFPYEVGKTLITGEDKYGNELEPMEKVSQIGSSVIPYIPAGVQGKKTITGIRDVLQGGAYTPSGKLKYPIDESVQNYVRGGLFGPYHLPEAKEYRKLDTTALSEKQTKLVKESKNPKETYKEIMDTRLQNRQIDKAKEVLKSSNQPTSKVGDVYLLKNDDGSISEVDITKEIQEPKLTGVASIDKKLKSSYKSKLTKRGNDIVKLYEAGQITLEQATALMDEVEIKYNSTSKAKKPKSIKVKSVKSSTPSISKSSFKNPAVIKSSPPPVTASKFPTIKIAKPKKIKVKAFRNTLAVSNKLV